MEQLRWPVAGMFFCSFIPFANAMFLIPQNVPVDRLVANGAAYVRENPNDVHGYYALGRTHYLAFVTKAGEVRASEGNLKWEIAREWNRRYLESGMGTDIRSLRWNHAGLLVLKEFGCASIKDLRPEDGLEYRRRLNLKIDELETTGWRPEPPSNAELTNHAANAKKNLQKATELDPNNALYHLALASLIEQYVEFLQEMNCDVTPDEFTSIILDRAREEYYAAYDLAVTRDLKQRLPPDGLTGVISHEAGEGYIRLTERTSTLSGQNRQRLTAVKENVKKLKALPMGAITPVVFSPNGSAALADLLDTNLRASFDLDGDGQVEKWPWVKPTTGILAWDPGQTGKITSGRQLFGSVTWWLFFADGYHALDALDDNRDGRLNGSELNGISVWFDRNSNGRADKGEVTPAEECGVTAIATKACGRNGDSLMNPAGVTLRNGSTVPSYDWVAAQDKP